MKTYLNFLSRNKGYTFINVLGMSVSLMFVVLIGAFAWQEWHIDRQFDNIDRIFVMSNNSSGRGRYTGTNYRVQPMLTPKFPEIEKTTALRHANVTLMDEKASRHRTVMMLTDSTFSDFFDLPLIEGSWKQILSKPQSAVITREFGAKMFGDVYPVGHTMLLNDTVPITVSGLMEPLKNTSFGGSASDPVEVIANFELMQYIDWWAYSPNMNQIGGTEVLLMASEGVDLAPNASLYQQQITESGYTQYTDIWGNSLEIVPLRGLYFRDIDSGNFSKGTKSMMTLLVIIGGAVLLFSFFNYINLTVAQSSNRAKEMATRRLLGSSRAAIMLQLMRESTLLCAFSMLIGIALAFIAAPYLSSLLNVSINLSLCFTPVTVAALAGIVLLMGLLAGIVPALLISSSKPIDVVRGTYRRRNKMVFSKVFIVIQCFLTIVMIGCTITIYAQYHHLVNAPLGYDYHNVVWMQFDSFDKAKRFKTEAAKLSCVEVASIGSSMPYFRGHNNTNEIDGQNVGFQLFFGDDEWLKVFGIEPESDNHNESAWFVNHELLNQFNLPDNAPTFPYGYHNCDPQNVRGVLPDIKLGTISSTTNPPMMLRVSSDLEDLGLQYMGGIMLFIRTAGDNADVYRQIADLYQSAFGEPIFDYLPFVDQMIENWFASTKRLSILIGLFAAIALIVSMLGMYAISSYGVQQRSLEIAIRKVNGDDAQGVVKRMMKPFIAYVLIAFVFAVPVIYWLSHWWLSDQTYRISVYWWIYALSGLLCLAVSCLTIYSKAHRAANANPVKALYQN